MHIIHVNLLGGPKKERFFGNISAREKNFEIKFHRLVVDSFIHLSAKYHQEIIKEQKLYRFYF